jgi:hypothetical protein
MTRSARRLLLLEDGMKSLQGDGRDVLTMRASSGHHIDQDPNQLPRPNEGQKDQSLWTNGHEGEKLQWLHGRLPLLYLFI